VDVVTGAFSFTGRYIAARLLEQGREVRTLTRRSPSESPFGDRVEAFSLDVSDPAPLRGVDTLYNTYWIRFPDRATTFADAVRQSVALFEAAQAAGVRRVVQLSVANADPDSPYAYFRGKAAVESALAASGLSHAVVRPTLVFGDGEVLLNNVAWMLRRFPLFLLPGAACRIQPIAAEDVAELCVEIGAGDENVVLDAAGPDVFAFEELVRLVRDAVGSRAAVVRGGPRTALALTRLLGAITRQTVLTREELGALRDDLLTSTEPPRGRRRLGDWLGARGRSLGAVFASGERRPWARRP
jgi:NADH dehydrogenase